MPRDRAIPGPLDVRTIIVVAVVWLALAVPLGAGQPDIRPPQISPAVTGSVQGDQRPAETTSDRLLAAAARLPIMLFWAGVAGVASLTVWIVSRLIRARPRRGLTHILFEDLSDLSAGRGDRLDRNRALAQSVVSRLQNPQPLATFELQMDVMPGANEPGFGGLQPVLTMASVLEYERTDHPIKIGAIEFSLRDLVTLVSQLFARPPEQYLEGWLIEANGAIEVGAQLLDHRRRPVFKRGPISKSGREAALARPLAWLVGGTGGRDRAIADLAAQILVDTDRSTLTSDWRSLRSFDEAMRLRDDQRFDAHPETSPAAAPTASASARGDLARSVSYDPSNWIARFSLAVTLCRDNEPLLALQHLDILEKAVTRAWPCVRKQARAKRTSSKRQWLRSAMVNAKDTSDGPGFRELVRHLETLPECAFLILFNEGIALAAAGKDDIESLRRARAVFEQLSAWMPSEPGCATPTVPVVTFASPYQEIAGFVSHQRRTTLALYAMGAHANLIAEAEAGRSGARLEDDPITALQNLLGRIDADCRVQNAAHWPSAMSARAITQAALGHVLFNRGRLSDARAHFEAALASEPRLVRALLGLAEIYLVHADHESHRPICDPARINEWLSRADALLGRAIAINAGCAQGRHLRDRVRECRFFAGRESRATV